MDRSDAQLSEASYAPSGAGWEVRTGPAHIMYSPSSQASGRYTASASFEQLEKPTHPEAFGIFIGGQNLEQPNQTYTYFIVRGSGEFLVKVREGDATRNVLPWTASADIPKENAAGRATYDLAAQVSSDAVRFLVNGKQIASVSSAGLPTDGIAGLRINHNLHVRATPVAIQTP